MDRNVGPLGLDAAVLMGESWSRSEKVERSKGCDIGLAIRFGRGCESGGVGDLLVL